MFLNKRLAETREQVGGKISVRCASPITAGKNVINHYFDQNRLFAGLGYQFTPHLNAHFGYLYVFRQLPAGKQYIHTNALRLFVFHNFVFRNR